LAGARVAAFFAGGVATSGATSVGSVGSVICVGVLSRSVVCGCPGRDGGASRAGFWCGPYPLAAIRDSEVSGIISQCGRLRAS
jgi:hypothetical protein